MRGVCNSHMTCDTCDTPQQAFQCTTYFDLESALVERKAKWCVHHRCMGEIARKLHALLMCMKREQAAGHIADTGGTEESLHDEYQGACHVAINQGVVLRLNLQ